MEPHILDTLYKILQTRKDADPENSYVASLYVKGAAKISEKVTEEAGEISVESVRLEKSPQDAQIRKALKHEAADLLFHLMVMLSYHDIQPQDVYDVLKERFGTSGHTEKAARS